MELIAAKTLALKLMKQHGLIDCGWSFKFDSAKRRFGLCKYHKKTISLSRYLTKLNNIDNVHDTILHEIAHALTPGHGHDYLFYFKCKKIGAKPKRLFSNNVILPKPKYVLKCNVCQKEYPRYRKPVPHRRYSCSECCNGRFNEKFILEFVRVDLWS